MSRASPERNLPGGVDPIWHRTEMPHDARYFALVDLASPAPPLRLGLHPTRTPPLLRLDHRRGAERRGTHHHPVGPGHRTTRRLEGDGDLRRDRRLEPRCRHEHFGPPGGEGPGRIWHGYHVSAVDDTKVHRSGEHVWGIWTFHEFTARCPNRAGTVRAHNWVVLGALLEDPDQPAWFLPFSGRLSFRKSQLPPRSGATGPKEVFRTKCELAVELLREQARILGGRHLAAFDGGFALSSVVRELVAPEDGSPRIEFLTRLRHDARLHAPLPQRHRSNQKWGKKLASPQSGGALVGAVARGARLHLRSGAEGPLEGDRLPVAGRGS
jgi:hypothetical protein